MPAEAPFDVAVVCRANRFRSPLAEAAIGRLTADLPVTVASYGTMEFASGEALPGAVAAAEQLGLDLSAHAARPLGGADLSGAGLVIGFERIHVASAVVDARAPRDHTFTLPELVELLRLVPVEALPPLDRARRAVQQAAALRGKSPTPPPELADAVEVGDYRRIAASVLDLSVELVERLFGSKVTWLHGPG
jgi:protein-tyrosine-phosphatase